MKLRVAREYLPLLATVVIAIALYCITGWLYPAMFTPRLTAGLLTDNAFLGIAAVGMTFVILSGGIDLSVGSILGCASIVIAMLIKKDVSAPLALAIVLLGGIISGAAMGCLIHFFNLPAFLVTLAGLFFFRGLALRISTDSIGIPMRILAPLKSLGFSIGEAAISIEALIFLVMVAAGAIAVRFTRWGRNVYAIGGSEQSALLMGLPVGAAKIGTYALSGFCAALSGCVYTMSLSSGNATAGVGLELAAIAAVVVGGTLLSGGVGGVIGTLIGVLIFGIIQMAIVLDGSLSSPWARIAVGILLMNFVLLQRLLTRRAVR